MTKLTDRVREGAHVLFEKAGDLQERIRDRARAIWERDDKPEGRHEDHWREAESEIAAEEADRSKKQSASISGESERPASPTGNKPRKSSKASAPVGGAATAKEAGKGEPAKTVGLAKPRRPAKASDGSSS